MSTLISRRHVHRVLYVISFTCIRPLQSCFHFCYDGHVCSRWWVQENTVSRRNIGEKFAKYAKNLENKPHCCPGTALLSITFQNGNSSIWSDSQHMQKGGDSAERSTIVFDQHKSNVVDCWNTNTIKTEVSPLYMAEFRWDLCEVVGFRAKCTAQDSSKVATRCKCPVCNLTRMVEFL